jgi:alkaline phosphatase
LKSSGRPVYESFAAIPADAKRAVVLLDTAEFSWEEAADKAIAILSKNPKGYFLMVENDVHTDNPKRGLDRVVALDKYVEKTVKNAGKNTLVIFTADHSFDFRIRSGKVGEPLTLPSTSKPTPAVAEAEAKTNARVNGTHTGEEVLVSAQGPGAEKVRGFMPNTELFRIMLAAFGWKP